MTTTRQVRRTSYSVGRMLGDFHALSSGDPKIIAKRFANKEIGKHVVSHMWLR